MGATIDQPQMLGTLDGVTVSGWALLARHFGRQSEVSGGPVQIKAAGAADHS
jgi:hypothetical protein